MASLITVLCVVGIFGLFYLNRDGSVSTSKALWIAIIWFWISGSRPISAWLGLGASGPMTVASIDDGSPTDAAVTLALMVIGLAILARRGRRPLALLKANWPIIVYFSYGLASLLWSDAPGIGMKRWIKATGDIIMALVVLTDPQPTGALQRLFSRLGFVLLPLSELFIRYYPELGRSFDVWGTPFNVGVTTNKNILGPVAFILTLGAAWQVLHLWKAPKLPNRSRRLTAQCTLVLVGIVVLQDAHSATSGTCFVISAALLMLTSLRSVRGRPRTVNALVLTLVTIGALIKVTGFGDAVVQLIGRNPDLTGRASDLWPLLIPMSPNVVVGAGFESFWTGARMQALWEKFPTLHVNESHNGYIETYLNLGVIGVVLIALIFVHAYRRSLVVIKGDPEMGTLIVAYLAVAVLYNYTEAGFRMLFYPWSFLILAILATGISRTYKQTPALSAALSGGKRLAAVGAQRTSVLSNY